MPVTHTVILTPTTRLARALAREAALRQTASGKTAWRSQPVLAFSAWLNQLREDYFLDAEDARTPISADQAHEVWKSVINTDIFIGEPRVADLAERAWRLLHEHQLAMPAQWPALLMNEDHRRFAEWTSAYMARCRQQQWVDLPSWQHELPELIVQGKISLPEQIVLAGFVLEPTPLQQRILAACRRVGCAVETREDAPESSSTSVQRYAANSDADELIAAAIWARRRLEQLQPNQPDARIAIVVPDLEGRVEQAEHALRKAFDPQGFALASTTAEPWHISLGKPLSHWPMTADALTLLGLNPAQLSQPELRCWLRSPFLYGWPEESLARAKTIQRLARIAPYEVTLFELDRDLTTHTSNFAQTLQAWRKVRAQGPEDAHPSGWTAQFQTELTALGFGRGRALNSQEHQLLARWQQLLEQFSALDAVLDRPLSRSNALHCLKERAGRSIFRERNIGVPVEVLGLKEALGSTFDALWMTSLDHDRWPPPARREPLIPGKVQQAVPESTSTGRLQQAEREIQAVLAAAPEQVLSYCIDPESPAAQRLSPMLDDGCTRDLELDVAETPAAATMEVLEHDARAPAVAAGQFKGGTGLFQKQSDCPFRAFAEVRLQAGSVPIPRPGLDAAQRGSLVHQALEAFWQALPDAASLRALDGPALETRIEQSAERALRLQFSKYRLAISHAARELEKQRLVRQLSEWLELEKQRPDFRVQAREQSITIDLGGVQTRGTIDRIDQPADDQAGTVLIDYKTGDSAKSGHWLPEPRMADVQLPAYALSVEPPPGGIAFAKLLANDVHFDGIQRETAGDDSETPAASGIRILGQFTRKHNLSEHESWLELMEQWRVQLDALGHQFLTGNAEVDPRNHQTCRYCHLHAFCRIHERSAFVADEVIE